MKRKGSRLLRTTTFRLAAVYLAVFALSVAAILGYVHWNTVGLLARQTDETIRAEITGLAEQYRQGGVTLLARTVAQRSRDAGANVYLVADFTRRRIAGNLNRIPPGLAGESGWVEFRYHAGSAEPSERHQARAFFTRLAGGFTLVVGRDIEAQREFAGLIRRTLVWAVGLAVALGIGGGLLMSRNFLKRIDSIGLTSRRIMHGDLSGRMPVRGSGDELDRLSTALNEMLDQIERLMKSLREVTDNVAHDLKSPLTRLRAQVEDALRAGTKVSYRAALERTLIEADDLLKTFEALLSIARTEAGEARATIAETDLGELITDLAELYEPSVEAAGGRLEIRTEGDLTVAADRGLIAQALSNLLDNALKYAGPADDAGETGERVLTIGLRARREGDRVELAVADNGPGIPEADRERVIQRFVRLDSSRSRPGSGLGLSLVAGVARLHGGEFRLNDNAPGLEAVITFPAKRTS